MFDGLQILSNTTKHDQIRSNSTKKGVQTVKCLVTKQCLMVFGRQTFPVCPGPPANADVFPAVTGPTVILGGNNDSRKYVCVRRLYSLGQRIKHV